MDKSMMFKVDGSDWRVGPCVYVIAKGEQALYIGTSSKGIARAVQHLPLASQIGQRLQVPADSVHLFGFDTDSDALAVESWLIHDVRPLGNRECRKRQPLTYGLMQRAGQIAALFIPEQREWPDMMCSDPGIEPRTVAGLAALDSPAQLDTFARLLKWHKRPAHKRRRGFVPNNTAH